MIKNIIFDLSNTLVFRRDGETDSLNDLHDKVSGEKDYKFFDNFFIHESTFDLLKKLSLKTKLILLTSGDFQEDQAFRPILDDIFSSLHSSHIIGLGKNDPSIYRFLLKKEDIRAHETLFIDDLQRNLDAAEIIGLKTHRYQSENELRILLNKLLTEDRE